MDDLSQDMLNAIRTSVMHNNRGGNFAIRDDNLTLLYRNTFIGNPDGRVVLKDLMERLGLFKASMDPLDMIQKNIALEILTCCGLDEGVMMETIIG